MSAPHIAPTAQVDPTALLGDDTVVGHFSVVAAGVRLGAGCRVGHFVVIHDDTVVGDRVRIDDHAVVGKLPMRAVRSATTTEGSLPAAVVGDDAIIGTSAILYRGCELGSRTMVADQATVRERVSVGAETIVGRGVAIESDCSVGARCKLETNAYITAYTVIEDDVFVAPGVLTSNDGFLGRTEERKKHFGGPHIRRGARLAVGAVVLPGREIAEEAVVGAGAVLTHHTDTARVYVGVPARPVRDVPPEQLLPPSTAT
jgi:serine O-acetyltransferase